MNRYISKLPKHYYPMRNVSELTFTSISIKSAKWNVINKVACIVSSSPFINKKKNNFAALTHIDKKN